MPIRARALKEILNKSRHLGEKIKNAICFNTDEKQKLQKNIGAINMPYLWMAYKPTILRYMERVAQWGMIIFLVYKANLILCNICKIKIYDTHVLSLTIKYIVKKYTIFSHVEIVKYFNLTMLISVTTVCAIQAQQNYSRNKW